MDDLISRQDVLMLAKDIVVPIKNGEYRHRCIDPHEVWKLPSAQRWIPVSERLPSKNEYGEVLVTFIPSGGTLWTKVMIARYSDLMGIAKPSFHIGSVGKIDFENITNQVTAWMPLPEPYRKADMRGE